MTMVLPALIALLFGAAPDRSESVSVLYPKAVWGASSLIAVERLAARYEQASGTVERSINAVDSDGNDADLLARCGDTGANQVLFLSPITLTVLASPARLQLSVQATLVRCADKRVARSSRNADIAGTALLEDPSVLLGYKALEASVIGDLLPH
jgi:hypothetical protein